MRNISLDAALALRTDDYSLQAMYNHNKRSKERSSEKHRTVSSDTIEEMGFHMLEWQCDERLSLKEMWRLPEKRFLQKRDEMVDYVEWRFHTVVEHLSSRSKASVWQRR
jgi:hypothetical protein